MDLIKKKALLILNPVAGRQTIQRNLSQVIRSLMDGGYLVTTAVTSERGEACKMASAWGGDYDLLVCAGGDGTLNECISGLASKGKRVPVGYLPCGSTNDYALSHGLITDPVRAAAAAASGKTIAFDIGQFSERYFLHLALFGAFTRMAYSTDQAQKNVLGYGAYVLDGLREFSNIKPIEITIRADGKVVEGEYAFGAFSTDGHIAGIYTLPETVIKPDDGVIAAVLIKTPQSVAQWDILGRSLLSGDHDCEMIDILSARHFEIRTKEEIEWSLDGESSGPRTKVSISAKQGFLTLRR